MSHWLGLRQTCRKPRSHAKMKSLSSPGMRCNCFKVPIKTDRAKCDTEKETNKGETEGTVWPSYITPVDISPPPPKKNNSEHPAQIKFSFSQHVSPRRGLSCIHDSAVSIVSTLHTSVYLMSSSTQPLDTACFAGERCEEMTHSSVKAQDTKSQLTCWSDGWYCTSFSSKGPGLCSIELSVELGEQVTVSPVWQRAQAGPPLWKCATSHRLI